LSALAAPSAAPKSTMPLLSKGAEVEAKIGTNGAYRRCVIVKKPKHGRWVDVYCDVSKTKVKRVASNLVRQKSDEGAHDVETEGGLPSSGLVVTKGAEVEAKIGTGGAYLRCVITKKPKHGRWVDVYCDVSKTAVKRVPTKLLRQKSEEGAHDVEVEGGHPVQGGLVVKKGVEVEAKIGSGGAYRRCVITKKPKHGRWVDVYCDVSKTAVKRVPSKLLRQVSDEGAKDVEVEGGAPVLHSGMKRRFSVVKGAEVEAKIGSSGKFRVAVVTKKPKHGRWVNVYCDVTKTVHKRVPTRLLRQKSDDQADDVEYSIAPALPPTMSIKDAMFPSNGQEVEVNHEGSWVRAQVIKVPKHRRWFNVYLDDKKVAVKRVPKSSIRALADEEDISVVMNKLKPTHKATHAYDATKRESTFRFEAYRSDKATAIKSAMARILAKRGRAPAELLQAFKPSKGMEVEAQIGTNGKFRRGIVVKMPKHGRWAHVYDDVDKKLVKRVDKSLIRQRSDDDNQPADLEME